MAYPPSAVENACKALVEAKELLWDAVQKTFFPRRRVWYQEGYSVGKSSWRLGDVVETCQGLNDIHMVTIKLDDGRTITTYASRGRLKIYESGDKQWLDWDPDRKSGPLVESADTPALGADAQA